MDRTTIKRSSWLYQLACIGGGLTSSRVTDICSLRWALLRGLILCTMIAFVVVTISVFVVYAEWDFLRAAYWKIWGAAEEGQDASPAGLFMGIANLIGFVIGSMFLLVKLSVAISFKMDRYSSQKPKSKTYEKPKLPKPPSTLSRMYTSFKEKTCHPVDIID
jgi:hypothetical protein